MMNTQLKKKLSQRYHEFSQKSPKKQDKQQDKIVIIDGLNLFMRHFQANPAFNDNGDAIGGVLGMYNAIKYAIREFNPSKVFLVVDGKGGSQRRRKIYPEYKDRSISIGSLNRPESFEGLVDEQLSLATQLSIFLDFIDLTPIRLISLDGVEADDCIAYLAKQILPKESLKIIISNDKDFLQLIGEDIYVYSKHKKGLEEKGYRVLITKEEMYSLYGYSPLNYLTYRVFKGDPSDNIRGVLQVGPAGLDKYFDLNSPNKIVSVEDIIEKSKEQLKEVKKPKKIFLNIVNQEDIALRNYRLMQLQNVDISGVLKMQLQALDRKPVDAFNLRGIFDLFESNGLIKPLQEALDWTGMFKGLR